MNKTLIKKLYRQCKIFNLYYFFLGVTRKTNLEIRQSVDRS